MITDFTGELSPLEQRADIPSLEGLHAQRRQLYIEYAPLRVLHGPGNRFDNQRKNFLSAIKIRARKTLTEGGQRTTEDAVDAAAHADDQYTRFVDEGVAAATRYVLLEMEVQEIEERIRNREISLLAYNSEIKLAR